MNNNFFWFKKGMKDGIPIMLGYFAVAFALGIAAKQIGLTAFQATLASFLNNASAGQYAGFTMIAAGATYLETAIMVLIANARYILMSCSLSQKLAPDTPLRHRLLVGFIVTDEIFGISIAVDGKLNPYYVFGAMTVAMPGWSSGTFLGAVMGQILPDIVVNALGVALFGMFLWIIIPPARKNKVLAGLIAISMGLSLAFRKLSWFADINDGLKTIILTVVISAAASLLFPVKEHTDKQKVKEDAANGA